MKSLELPYVSRRLASRSFHPLAMSESAAMLRGDSAGHDGQWLRHQSPLKVEI